MLPPRFTLTQSEKLSPLWQRLREHLEKELADQRGKNDGPLTPERTLTVRGHIECLKGLLALGQEPPDYDG